MATLLTIDEAHHTLVSDSLISSVTIWSAADATGDGFHQKNNPQHYADARLFIGADDIRAVGRYVRVKIPALTGGYQCSVDRLAISRMIGTDKGQMAEPVEILFGGTSGFGIDVGVGALSDWVAFPLDVRDMGYWIHWELHTDTLWSFPYWDYQDGSRPNFLNTQNYSYIVDNQLELGGLPVEPDGGPGASFETAGEYCFSYGPTSQHTFIEKIEAYGEPVTTPGTLTVNNSAHAHVSSYQTLGYISTDDFSNYATGTPSEDHWLLRWYYSYRYVEIVADASYTGGKALKAYSTFLGQPSFYWWKKPFPVQGPLDQDIITRFKLAVTTDRHFWPCVVRGRDTWSTYYYEGYLLELYPATGKIDLKRADHSTAFTVLDTMSATINTGTWYYCRLQAIGTAIRAKFWADGSPEPSSWMLEATDDTYFNGVPGVGSYASVSSSADSPVIDYISVGTSGLQALPLGTLAVQDGNHTMVSDEIGNFPGTAVQLTIADDYLVHACDQLDLAQLSVLGVLEAYHDHIGDNIDLEQQYYLSAIAAYHNHGANTLVIAQQHQLNVSEPYHLHAIDAADLLFGPLLELDAVVHDHTAEGITLAQVHQLSVADASHDHLAEEPTMTWTVNLAVAAADQLHAADGADLVQAHSLIVAGTYNAHASPQITLIAGIPLEVFSCNHLHVPDSPWLTGTHQLTIAAIFHAHSAAQPALTGTAYLIVAAADHISTVDALALTGTHGLIVAQGDHALAIDALLITQAHALTVNASTIEATADALALTQTHFLVATDTSLALTSATFWIVQIGGITVDDSAHSMTDKLLLIFQDHALATDSIDHLQTVDALSLGQLHRLAMDAPYGHSHHLHLVDAIRFAALPVIDTAPRIVSVTVQREVRSLSIFHSIERKAA